MSIDVDSLVRELDEIGLEVELDVVTLEAMESGKLRMSPEEARERRDIARARIVRLREIKDLLVREMSK